MSSLQRMDYNFSTKRHWRRWLWNRIAERCDSPRNALVLFLAGERAADVEVAEAKGFRRANMIAVEKDASTLRKLRAASILTIEGDLVEVLQAWPEDRSIGVVLGDFCSGLERQALKALLSVVTHRPLHQTTFAFNLLRGRDSSTNELRRLVRQADPSRPYLSRAEQLWLMWGTALGSKLFEDREYSQAQGEWLEAWSQASRPAATWYRSTAGSQHFDAMVFRQDIRSWLKDQITEYEELPRMPTNRACPSLLRQSRRTAAVLAHHTRRLALL